MLYYTFAHVIDKCKIVCAKEREYDLTELNLKQAVFWIGEVYAFGAKTPISQIGFQYLCKLRIAENLNNLLIFYIRNSVPKSVQKKKVFYNDLFCYICNTFKSCCIKL